MELKIDGQRCDLGGRLPELPKYDAAALADVDACREGRTLRVVLPVTGRNDAAARFARDPYAVARFNDELHTAELTHEGAVLFAGAVRLLSASDEEYVFEVRDGGAWWAKEAAQAMISELGVDYKAALTPTTVCDSWTAADTPVRFFPVHRDEYPRANSSDDLLPAERMLSVDDYRPFLHLATVIDAIFGQAGYRVQSDFLHGEFFRSLYMSGAYASHDTAAATARMGFHARRLAPATAQAGPTGRVFADPTAIYNTVGNIVDTATPQTLDADGEPIADLANNGGCFRMMKNGAVAFVPPTSVRVGFDYYLRYTTDYRIASRTRLKGFDTLYLGPGSEVRFQLANRYVDRRGALTTNYTYRVLVFDHTAGAEYRLTYRNGTSEVAWLEFASRSAQATTPTAGVLSDPVLYVADGAWWVPYAGDWALYDGHIGETGRTTVEVRVSTATELVTPTSPKYFYHIYFAGAEPGMNLTLHKECSLEPVFRTGPGFGSNLDFGEVAQLRVRQIEVLRAVAHLFNLRFHTDEATKTVYVEPVDDFFGAGPEADWSGRTDFLQPVVRQDIAPEVHERRTWCYREGDGPVHRLESEQGTAFGEWSCAARSKATLAGEKVYRNTLFAPTVSAAGHYRNAPSALLLEMGDRDDLTQDEAATTPRIVRYAGMHALPEGERWGYPSNGGGYPLAAFHFAGDAATAGFTLCFEDRDGVQGLNRYYARQAAREGALERITLTLRVAPDEYEALFVPELGLPNIRSVFRIDTGQGVVRATLAAVESYDAEAHALRATFERQEKDIY
ncbi:MAG: hypothetical protein NC226_02800 [Bacteroides cellulosilyticus]|nr:hypothetical protein [Bacteroides cellulosilyticus]